MLADSSHHAGQGVGARLRQARLAKKYTQNQLAHPDFSVSYISAIERGQIQPSLRALEILAQRLELSTTDLLPTSSAKGGVALASSETIAGNEERELFFLEARIAIYQGKAERAIEVLQSLLPPKSERRHERFSELYFLLGWAYLEAGRLSESEQLLAEAAHLSKGARGPFYLNILSLQNTVYKAMQNTEQAVQVRRESLRVLAHPSEATDNADFLAQLYASLAQHYGSMGEYEQAVENFQQALRLLQLQHSCPQLQETYQNLLHFYTDKGLYSLAILYAYKGLLTDLRCRMGDRKNGIEYALGKVLLKHDPDKASIYLLERVKNAEARNDALALSGAYAQLARWQITRGDLNQAAACIALAQQHVTPFEGTLIHADIQLLAGELAYKYQDYDAGDRLFEDGLALLQKVGEREDLIEQFARYAQLLEERNCIQKSIMYWKLAYESQQKNRMSTF